MRMIDRKRVKRNGDYMQIMEKDFIKLEEVITLVNELMEKTGNNREKNTDVMDKWTENQIKDGVNENEKPEQQGLVEKARVRCTCCIEKISEVYVYQRTVKYTEYAGGTYPLNHKDTVFKEEFSGCINTEGGICNIEILDDVWLDPNEETEIGDGYEIDEENSYMICKTGYGMIYATDSGQIKVDMEEKLEEELLDRIINENAFRAMGWPLKNVDRNSVGDENEQRPLLIVDNYGEKVFDELKDYMKTYNIVNPISIKMFLATIQHESGGLLLEGGDADYFEDKSYTQRVRGAGLIQLTGEDQETFLRYKYSIEEDDIAREKIKGFVDGYFKNTNGKRDKYDNLGEASQFIAEYYPIESATWYWGGQKKLSCGKEGGESLNEFVSRHANDNQFNTFVATQMAVNGKAYKDSALDRFSESENDCRVIRTEEIGCNEKHYKGTGYCFFFIEDGGEERHDYGPGNWEAREKAYEQIEEFFSNEM